MSAKYATIAATMRSAAMRILVRRLLSCFMLLRSGGRRRGGRSCEEYRRLHRERKLERPPTNAAERRLHARHGNRCDLRRTLKDRNLLIHVVLREADTGEHHLAAAHEREGLIIDV